MQNYMGNGEPEMIFYAVPATVCKGKRGGQITLNPTKLIDALPVASYNRTILNQTCDDMQKMPCTTHWPAAERTNSSPTMQIRAPDYQHILSHACSIAYHTMLLLGGAWQHRDSNEHQECDFETPQLLLMGQDRGIQRTKTGSVAFTQLPQEGAVKQITAVQKSLKP